MNYAIHTFPEKLLSGSTTSEVRTMVEARVPAEAFPPGKWIREGLEDHGWTQGDLAEILGRPIQLVNELIAAKKSITPETAKGLAQAFGTSAQFWLNLDAAYQLYITRDADPTKQEHEQLGEMLRSMLRQFDSVDDMPDWLLRERIEMLTVMERRIRYTRETLYARARMRELVGGNANLPNSR